MNIFRTSLIFLLCAIASVSLQVEARAASRQPSRVESDFQFLDEIDDIVNANLQVFKVPGASIGIVADGQTIFCRGYGSRNAHEDLPVTESTLFCIASCTKSFTSLLLGQLVDEGKVCLDDPVVKYIPELRLWTQELTEDVTIRDLLAHRSGIDRQDVLWVLSNPTRPILLKLMQHIEPVCGLREEFQYNNIMYSIAGMVIERITGQSWEETIALRLFIPLEMSHSNTSIEHLQMSADYCLPHTEIDGKVQAIPFRNAYPINPGGGINSNALDMTKWLELHLSEGNVMDKEIVSIRTLNELHTAHMPVSNSPNPFFSQTGYGLGWFIGKYRGHDWISHGGHIDGFSSDMSLLPAKKFGLVILTNSGDEGHYFITAMRNQILDKFLGTTNVNWSDIAENYRDISKNSLKKALSTFKKMSRKPQPIDSLQDFVGGYEHPSYGTIRFSIVDGHLMADYGTASIPLYAKSDNILTGQFRELLGFGINPAVDFTFSKDIVGHIDKVQVPFEGFRGAKPITFLKN